MANALKWICHMPLGVVLLALLAVALGLSFYFLSWLLLRKWDLTLLNVILLIVAAPILLSLIWYGLAFYFYSLFKIPAFVFKMPSNPRSRPCFSERSICCGAF